MSQLATIAEKQLAESWRGWVALTLGERRRVSQIVHHGAWLAQRPYYKHMLGVDRGRVDRELRGELRDYVKKHFGGWALVLRLLVPLIVQLILGLLTEGER